MNKKGFTILELSIAIIIMGMLMTLIISALGPTREGNRNTKRVADINEIQDALARFYRDWGDYPSVITPGQALISGSNTYMVKIPQNPRPRPDGNCPDAEYSYSRVPLDGSVSYSISFCLSAQASDVGPGTSYAIPGHIITCIPNCARSCGTGSNNCGGTCPNAAACASGETCVLDHCVKD